MDSIFQDARFGARMLRKNAGFSLVAVITLALGIGATAAIFSYVDATWLRPLPVRDANRVVRIYTAGHNSAGEYLQGESSYVDYLDLRKQATSFEDMIAFEHRGGLLHNPGEVTRVRTEVVSPNYFSGLDVSAMLGRTFTEREAQGNDFPVVISYELWRQQFSSDPGIVGKQIRLTNGMVTIAGVMPRWFRGTDLSTAPGVWVPIRTWMHMTESTGYEFTRRGNRRQEILARLRPGVPLEQAQAELNTIAARLAQTYPETNKNEKLTVRSESEARGSSSEARLLLAIAAMVMLIACANVANLQLARGEARKSELAIRTALGGGRARLARQLLTESFLLCLTGGAAALLLAQWMIEALPHMFAGGTLTAYDFRLDKRVLLFVAFVTLCSVLLFGLVPAIRGSQANPLQAMKDGRAPSSRRGHFPLRSMLVVVQVALSLILLVSSGLLIRTLINIKAIDPGFDSRQRMLIVFVVPGLAKIEDTAALHYYDQALQQLRALPGVEKASMVVRVPFDTSGGGAQKEVVIPGVDAPQGQKGFAINFSTVGADYFSTMGTRLQLGRMFGPQDNERSPGVTIINETMARRFWPGESPLGRHVSMIGWHGSRECEIVGVVEDAKWNSLIEPPRPLVYVPAAQDPSSEMTFLLKTRTAPETLVGPVRDILHRIDPNVPVYSIRTLKSHMEFTMEPQRNHTILAGSFGALGLALAMAGIYGVLSYVLSVRTHEIGIRLAVGAQPRNVLRLMLGAGLRMAGIGLAVGLAGALALTRLVSSVLFGVKPTDPLTLVAACGLLAAVALLASYIPARRAMRVDPMIALRYE